MISMAAFDLIIDQICKGLLGFTSVQFQRELLVFNPLIIIMNITVTKMMGCKGTFQKRFSGFFPLRGTPPRPLPQKMGQKGLK